MLQKLEELLETGKEENILLALELANSQGITLDFSVYYHFYEWWRQLRPEVEPVHSLLELLLSLLNVQVLDLSSLHLKEVPTSIGCLKNLQALHLSYNYLTQLPESLGELHHLGFLDLSDNRLEELPASLTQLHQLNYLYLNRNNLWAQSIQKFSCLYLLHESHIPIVRLTFENRNKEGSN